MMLGHQLRFLPLLLLSLLDIRLMQLCMRSDDGHLQSSHTATHTRGSRLAFNLSGMSEKAAYLSGSYQVPHIIKEWHTCGAFSLADSARISCHYTLGINDLRSRGFCEPKK